MRSQRPEATADMADLEGESKAKEKAMITVKTPFRQFECSLLEWIEVEYEKSRNEVEFARAVDPAGDYSIQVKFLDN